MQRRDQRALRMFKKGNDMRYSTPELRNFGTFTGLTKGQGGSCPDGTGLNNQRGGGSIGGTSTVECGPGTGGNG